MQTRTASSFRAVHNDDVDWIVADRSGRVLARNISFAQLRARYEHGLLPPTTVVARADDRLWRPVASVMEGSGARKLTRTAKRSWYVAQAEGKVVGPVDTDLLRRGIATGRVPLDSLVCEAGQSRWQCVDRMEVFSDAASEARFDGESTSAFAPLRWSFEDEV